ncbi:MAG: putative nucleotidyltransferase substrate binding domain-containing protein [Campylobacterota bacterium]|nr:putative nucleotidyltransferase substrate binding domain-containing protein [Campylobacterota bacterium]
MSILDQRKLIESIHPFELLSSTELDNLMHKIDIAYYTKDTLLISNALPSIAFYIIIKGSVNEYIDDELHNVYGEGDSFDSDALIYHETQSKFVVDEDLICYEIKKDDFLELMQNKKVQSYFLQDFVSRHQNLKEYENQGDLTPFLMSKVSDMYLHNACIVKSSVSIITALEKMKEYQARVIVVKNPAGEYCIVTDSNLIDNLILGDVDKTQTIATIASHGIVSIDKNDFLFNALLLMTHNGVKRVVVMENDRVVGILEQLDLLSYFANHSHLIAVQIDKAKNIDELKDVQNDLRNLILTLQAKGVKVRYITKLVSTLNEKMYQKLFKMFVPQELQDKCTLIVMGSEGRAEQTVKTDQDNALIVADGVDVAQFEKPMMEINSALLELGYPKCDGNVMVSNEFWRRDVNGYKSLIDSWVTTLNEENLQNMSIFLDAKSIAGNSELLESLSEYFQNVFSSRKDVLAHTAKAVLSFETPLSLFSSFVLEKEHNNKLDLKKGGIFALVHGVRVLSLEQHITETNTIERIKELNNKNIIDKKFATELIESFDTLSSIRLKAMLESKEISESNYINPQKLEKNQRDLLKDSFKIINKFKKFMSFHFHLEMVS